ncbi:maleylpyruvate isomerase N-terminal domain-containing protein [Pararhizobium polonicum]|uniref:maleylpyruvate isomerase N-terminal domain-containing protein n=1 Tax=Pararhizobium polonicum TaxID=1612624 RepID=UPI00083B5ECB|nr:maleylpyruvate isomerase N-terminal domain-containing protein [Pararhizobium polonicum]
MTRDLEAEARDALRARQGAGARYDAASAPVQTLSWARRGTAYFARKLRDLSGSELCGPSLVPGWTRAHVIAHVSYHARGMTRLIEAVRDGQNFHASAQDSQVARRYDIDLGATLPDRALRNLFDHSEIHLNVEWRDLTDRHWEIQSILETPWERAQEVWLRAVDLNNGGSTSDFPTDLLDRLKLESEDRVTLGRGQHPATNSKF